MLGPAKELADCRLIYDEIPIEKKQQACAFLHQATPDNEKEAMAAMAARNPKMWFAANHFGIGLRTRTLLRKQGHDEKFFDVALIDDIYMYLIEDMLAMSVEDVFKIITSSIEAEANKLEPPDVSHGVDTVVGGPKDVVDPVEGTCDPNEIKVELPKEPENPSEV